MAASEREVAMIDTVLSEEGFLRVLESNKDYWGGVKEIEDKYGLPPLRSGCGLADDGALDRWTEECQRKGIEKPYASLLRDIQNLNKQYKLPALVFLLLLRGYSGGIVEGYLRTDGDRNGQGGYILHGTTVGIAGRSRLGFWEWQLNVPFWPMDAQALEGALLSQLTFKGLLVGTETPVPPNQFVVLDKDPEGPICWLVGTERHEGESDPFQMRWYLQLPFVPADARLLGSASMEMLDLAVWDFNYDHSVIASPGNYERSARVPRLIDAIAGGSSQVLEGIKVGTGGLDISSLLRDIGTRLASGVDAESSGNLSDESDVDALDKMTEAWHSKYREAMAKGQAMTAEEFAEHLQLRNGLPPDVWFAFYGLAKHKLKLDIDLE